MTNAPPEADDPSGPPAYLIVLRHVVGAQDIALTIADFDGGAAVVRAASADEGLVALDGVARLAVAFVAEGPRRFAGSALQGAIARRGGRVVLIGEEAEAEGEAAGYAVLARPFASAAVVAHLDGRA
jgi:hypothetical protein